MYHANGPRPFRPQSGGGFWWGFVAGAGFTVLVVGCLAAVGFFFAHQSGMAPMPMPHGEWERAEEHWGGEWPEEPIIEPQPVEPDHAEAAPMPPRRSGEGRVSTQRDPATTDLDALKKQKLRESTRR
jgi:hypothetical protein